MDSDQELRLRVEIRNLEYKQRATISALRYGWIPFVVIGFLIITGLVIALAIGSSLFSDTSDVQALLSLCFVVLILGLVIFYAIAFFRTAKISAKLSRKQAILEMKTGSDKTSI